MLKVDQTQHQIVRIAEHRTGKRRTVQQGKQSRSTPLHREGHPRPTTPMPLPMAATTAINDSGSRASGRPANNLLLVLLLVVIARRPLEVSIKHQGKQCIASDASIANSVHNHRGASFLREGLSRAETRRKAQANKVLLLSSPAEARPFTPDGGGGTGPGSC